MTGCNHPLKDVCCETKMIDDRNHNGKSTKNPPGNGFVSSKQHSAECHVKSLIQAC